MKRKQKYLLFILLFSMKVMFSYSQDTNLTTDTLIKIASNGLEKYLNMIRNENAMHYGFNSINDLEHVELGNPIQTFMLSRSFYEDSVLKNDDYIIPTGEYKIPLLVNDTIRSFLKIGKLHNQWKVVGMGGSGLAENLMRCIQKYKLDRKKRILLLLETASQSYYLIYFEKTEEPVYLPIPSTEGVSKDFPNKKMTKEETLPLIHQKYYSDNTSIN